MSVPPTLSRALGPKPARVRLDDPFRTQLGPTLRRVLQWTYADFAATFGKPSLTPQRYAALRMIDRLPGQNQSEIAGGLGIARSGVMIMMHALEKEGLVERAPHATDRRSYGLVVTEQGKAVTKEFAANVASHNEKILAQFSTAERETLFDLLYRVVT